VVANADDPMVAWAASGASEVRWVGAGQVWHEDAVGCPACGGRIEFADSGGWACDTCEFSRPTCQAWLEGPELVLADGSRHEVKLGVPGQFNRANAAMVVTALAAMDDRWDGGPGRTVDDALAAMATVEEVAGRFSTVTRNGVGVRLLLAKNPAGWTALFDLLDESESAACPAVLSVNARIADGLDTSWLWDVPFERLRGRTVVATGERCRDLAVRLRYAEVDHTVVPDPVAALDVAIQGTSGKQVEFVGNYTAFAVLRGRL
jgi:UDP-N-acetylmuramyl tripeptide synthase